VLAVAFLIAAAVVVVVVAVVVVGMSIMYYGQPKGKHKNRQ
jgi:hypothetical protein